MHISIYAFPLPKKKKKSQSIKNTFYKINTSVFFLTICGYILCICVYSQAREVHITIINADDRY